MEDKIDFHNIGRYRKQYWDPSMDKHKSETNMYVYKYNWGYTVKLSLSERTELTDWNIISVQVGRY